MLERALDQAHGLRRLFAHHTVHLVPVVSNPHAAGAHMLMEGLCHGLAAQGLHTLVVESEALRRNPLGDPHVRELPVYEPPGGAAGTPLIAVLAGFGGTGAGALAGTPWDPGFAERYERLLREGRARPATFAFPDAFTRYGGSQYVDSTATGNYERYLSVRLTGEHNITTGKVYLNVIEKERRGDYLGKTVQIVPHVTD